MSLLGQSGVTGGGLDHYNVHALFVNMDNMWAERFGNYDCLVSKSQWEYVIILSVGRKRQTKTLQKINKLTWYICPRRDTHTHTLTWDLKRGFA